jgi:hypothetical protein
VLRRRFRSRSRLGAALQLGFVRMTGATPDAFDYVLRAVHEHVGHQLEISAPQLTRRRRPIKVREIAEPRRTLEVAALLSVTATRQSDTVLGLGVP